MLCSAEGLRACVRPAEPHPILDTSASRSVVGARSALALLLSILAPAPLVHGQSSAPAPLAHEPRPGVTQVELMGRSLADYPYFEYVRAVLTGHRLEVALDPTVYPQIAGRPCDLFIVAHRSPGEWAANALLTDVRGAPLPVAFGSGNIQTCTVFADPGFLSGDAGVDFGVPYDVVLDFDRNQRLGPGDFIDGIAGEAGFYVVAPPELPGPLDVTEVQYSGGTFLGQDTYYPNAISTMGKLPLVVVSHGNGHNYQWYDHIGYHLASWGCIVMSHQNQTMPGIETASTTTLTNTDYILANQAQIAGGVLDGHIDGHRIVWIGHSRGGEGVVRAFDRLIDGTYTPAQFTAADIVLISSIAPTDFLGPASANPHDANYHLWVGGADSDVNGCASCTICQSFHLLDRASGTRQSISLHGAGHGAFHNGSGGLFAAGPCLLTRAETHAIMKGYLVPLVKRYTDGNVPAKDFLWRQWETFRPDGAPVNTCVTVDLTYAEGPSAGDFVVDDFQSNPELGLSSSGGAVTADVDTLVEGRFDDADASFTPTDLDPMNGMTLGGASDTTAGVVLGWTDFDRFLAFEIVPGARDLTDHAFLSFRACQTTRTKQTNSEKGDLTFAVTLIDETGGAGTIFTGVYGGGVEEPYQRTGCGGTSGPGWGNEFETLRLRLSDFTRNGSPLDLSRVASIEFRFGPSFGSSPGRIGLDDVVITRD